MVDGPVAAALEAEAEAAVDDRGVARAEPEPESPAERRLRLLRNIAVAASRGVGYGLIPPKPREDAPPAAANPAETPGLFSIDPPPAADTMNHHEPR